MPSGQRAKPAMWLGAAAAIAKRPCNAPPLDAVRCRRRRRRLLQVSVPAAVVNSGLKYMQKRIKLSFMRRLTHHLHEIYTSHRAYYAASTLGGGCAGRSALQAGALPWLGGGAGWSWPGLASPLPFACEPTCPPALLCAALHPALPPSCSRSHSCLPAAGLTNADQRITEDVERFAHTVSELYSYTFKPLLDVALFTRSLSRVMGYRRQFCLYGYYLVAAQVRLGLLQRVA